MALGDGTTTGTADLKRGRCLSAPGDVTLSNRAMPENKRRTSRRAALEGDLAQLEKYILVLSVSVQARQGIINKGTHEYEHQTIKNWKPSTFF